MEGLLMLDMEGTLKPGMKGTTPMLDMKGTLMLGGKRVVVMRPCWRSRVGKKTPEGTTGCSVDRSQAS